MKNNPLDNAWWAIACVVTIGACAGLHAANEKACPQTYLAKIEAEYIAEAVASCKAEGATSAAECKSLPAIKDKYDAKRKAWVECK